MKPLAASPVRIARPSHDLRAAERFWVGGLGLDVLFRADDSAEGGHALLMVGWPGAASLLALTGREPTARWRAYSAGCASAYTFSRSSSSM